MIASNILIPVANNDDEYGVIHLSVRQHIQLAFWRGGRVADCTGLENRSGCKPTASSNLALSAFRFADFQALVGKMTVF